MPFNEKLADRIRESLVEKHGIRNLEEKRLFQGWCFMVEGKMCISVRGDEMMCRVGSEYYEQAMERKGTRAMIHGARIMKGFVFVSEDGYRDRKDFDDWIGLCLAFNKIAPATGKKQRHRKK